MFTALLTTQLVNDSDMHTSNLVLDDNWYVKHIRFTRRC